MPTLAVGHMTVPSMTLATVALDSIDPANPKRPMKQSSLAAFSTQHVCIVKAHKRRQRLSRKSQPLD